MRKRNFILLLVFIFVVPVLLSGCFLWPKKAILTLGYSPNWVPLSTQVTVTQTLRELNGVGVSLNYIKWEWFDQWGNGVVYGEYEGPAAESRFQSFFGTSYIPGNGELSFSYLSLNLFNPERCVTIYGGIDDNGNTVRTSAEIRYGM